MVHPMLGLCARRGPEVVRGVRDCDVTILVDLRRNEGLEAVGCVQVAGENLETLESRNAYVARKGGFFGAFLFGRRNM